MTGVAGGLIRDALRAAKVARDPLGDVDRAVSPAGTADRDGDIGFPFRPVAGEEDAEQFLDALVPVRQRPELAA